MPVKYLSPEWIDAYNAAVASDDSVRKALKGKSAVIQMVVADAPVGEVRYWLRIDDGTASVGLGDAGQPGRTRRGEGVHAGQGQDQRQDDEDDAVARPAGGGPEGAGHHRHRVLMPVSRFGLAGGQLDRADR